MGKSSPTPDNSAVIAAQASSQAAQDEYQLGQQNLAFEQQQWATDQPLITQVANADIAAQNQQNAFSQVQENAYENTYLPLEQAYAQQAQNYDTPAQETLNAGAAEGAVASQFNGMRQSAMQQLEGYGVDPTSTRFAALDIGTGAQQGAAEAAAGTSAIQQTKALGMNYEQNAINTGLGVASGSVNSTNSATGAGSGSSSSTIGGLNSATNAMTAPTSWYNSGANNMNVYANAVNGFNYAQNQAAQISNQSMMGMGSLFGGLMGMIPGFEDGGPVSEAVPVSGSMQPGVIASATPGGAVPTQASPTQGKAIDDVPARLTAGEFVVPKDVVNWFGQKHFVDTIDKARKGQQQLGQRQDIGGEPAQAIPASPTFVSRPQPQAIPVGLH
jgi:hypothetical protein